MVQRGIVVHSISKGKTTKALPLSFHLLSSGKKGHKVPFAPPEKTKRPFLGYTIGSSPYSGSHMLQVDTFFVDSTNGPHSLLLEDELCLPD